MRIAVLSDIHGNLPALNAVLNALKPYDAIWQLGDVVGYGPQPDEVVERLAQENAVGVRGNHDSAAIGELDTDSFNDDARAAVEWTAERIEPETRNWLGRLPKLMVDPPFTLVHGSPRDPTWEYIFSAAIARANLDAFETPYCLYGHTHIPAVFRDTGPRVESVRLVPGSSYELDADRLIINPGSVGQPRDGDPRASAAILDTDRGQVEWHRVEYPIGAVQGLMRRHKLPERLIDRLQFGL